ncbi:MAG: alpha-isopropylmalate synthase regulatory domain-containing protein [Syntrophaceticus schinkii]
MDLEALVKNEIRISKDLYHLSYLHVFSGTNIVPTATIGLKRNGLKYEEAACGDGPVDAAYKAIDKALGGHHVALVDYNLNAITGGKDALGEVMVRVQYKDKYFIGRGVSTDVIEASVKAYLNALNKVLQEVGEDAL